MSNHGNALLRRVRGKLLREVPVWGLSNPVTVEGDGGIYQIDSSSENDALIAEGFVTAEVAMFNTDLRRRLWSGRLSELIGDHEIAPGIRSPDLDVFVRIVGFRADAERTFRGLTDEAKSRLDLYTKGINGWTDAGLWRKQPCWSRADSRPRLWAPSDSLLLAQASERMAASSPHPLQVSEEAKAAGWTEKKGQLIRRLWDLLRSLPHDHKEPGPGNSRAPDAIFRAMELSWGRWDPANSFPSGIPAHLFSTGSEGAGCGSEAAPAILPVTVLPGGDNHRYARDGQPPKRLQARRHDIEVRQSGPQRHWIRRSEGGGLIGDLVHRANGTLAPAGQSFYWSWDGTHSEDPSQEPIVDESLDFRLVNDGNTRSLPKTRLVPIQSGAW